MGLDTLTQLDCTLIRTATNVVSGSPRSVKGRTWTSENTHRYQVAALAVCPTRVAGRLFRSDDTSALCSSLCGMWIFASFPGRHPDAVLRCERHKRPASRRTAAPVGYGGVDHSLPHLC